jgi:hypothetical protein
VSNYSLAAREPRACKLKHCGKIFTPPKRHSKYCSVPCADIGRSKNQKKPLPEIACRRCGTLFTPPNTTSTYCSKSCWRTGVVCKHKVDEEDVAERGISTISKDQAIIRARRFQRAVADGEFCLTRVSKQFVKRYNEARDLIRKENKCRSN